MAMFPLGRGLNYMEKLKASTVGRLGEFTKSGDEVKRVEVAK